MGGEEFAVVLPGADAVATTTLAHQLRQVIRHHPMRSQHNAISVTVSIGIASLAPHEPVEHAISRADAALYRAKSNGRDCVAA